VSGDESGRGGRDWLESQLGRLLELLGLTGVAVGQPVLDIFSESPDTFVFLGAETGEIVLFTVTVVFLPAAVLWGIELVIAALSERLVSWLHIALVALLAGVIVVEALREVTDLGSPLLLTLGAVAGMAAAILRFRFSPVRTWLRILGVTPALFAALFLFASPVTEVAFGSGVDPSEVRVKRPAPVVMVVLDELPTASLLDDDGRLDGAAFPGFGALARDGTWYRNHTTVAQNTPQAVPALLTGRYPTDSTIAPVASEHPDNLFTLLGGGYERQVIESFTRLCSGSGCSSAAAGDVDALTQLVKDAVTVWQRIASPHGSDDATVILHEVGARGRDFEGFIGSLRASPRPRLDYLHVQLPHIPYSYLPSGVEYDQPTVVPGARGQTWFDQDGADLARHRHVLQLRYVDRLLGQLVERMRRLGAYDESLVVVTSDHGAAFHEGSGHRAVSDENYPDIAWTPLFIKAPGQHGGRVDDRAVRSIDILPTVADHLDVDLPFAVDGTSLLGRPRHTAGRADDRVRLFRASFDLRPPDSGDFHTFDWRDGFESLLERGAHLDHMPRFGPYRYGEHGELVGRAVRDFELTSTRRMNARLHRTEYYQRLQVPAPRMPALVSWAVETVDDLDFVIAVNGTIGGWSPALPVTDHEHSTGAGTRVVQAVVPPFLFRRGDNEVRLYVIEDSGDQLRLAPIA
jgi:hypothetical protein